MAFAIQGRSSLVSNPESERPSIRAINALARLGGYVHPIDVMSLAFMRMSHILSIFIVPVSIDPV